MYFQISVFISFLILLPVLSISFEKTSAKLTGQAVLIQRYFIFHECQGKEIKRKYKVPKALRPPSLLLVIVKQTQAYVSVVTLDINYLLVFGFRNQRSIGLFHLAFYFFFFLPKKDLMRHFLFILCKPKLSKQKFILCKPKLSKQSGCAVDMQFQELTWLVEQLHNLFDRSWKQGGVFCSGNHFASHLQSSLQFKQFKLLHWAWGRTFQPRWLDEGFRKKQNPVLASERPSYIKERTHLLCGGQHKSLETPDLQLGAEREDTFRRHCFLPSVLSSSFTSLHIQEILFSAFCLVLKFSQLRQNFTVHLVQPGLCLERRFCPSLRLSSSALSGTLTGSSGIYLLKSLGLPTFPESLPCSVPCQFWGCEEMTTSSLWPREEVVRHDLPQQQ